MRTIHLILAAVYSIIAADVGAEDKAITLSADGVRINGVFVTEPAKNGKHKFSLRNFQAALGKADRVVEINPGQPGYHWEGISYQTGNDNERIEIQLWGFGANSSYQGLVEINGVRISGGVPMTSLNASLGDDAFIERPSPRFDLGTIWDLECGNILIRARCDARVKVTFLEVVSRENHAEIAPDIKGLADEEIAAKLRGYWASPRHEYLFHRDGKKYMVGGTTTSSWNIKDGKYIEDSTTYEILELSGKRFVHRDPKHKMDQYTMVKCNEESIKALREYYADWMDEHR